MNNQTLNTDNQIKISELKNIDNGWSLKILFEIARTYSGATPNRSHSQYWQNSDIPWLKSGELKDSHIYAAEESINSIALEETSVKLVNPNTLLIAMYGATAGKVGLSEIKAGINQAICAIELDPKFATSLFIFYWLLFIRASLLAERFGGAQPNLNQQIIKNINVHLPPLSEQKKIANVLSSVQDARDKTQSVINSLKELKKSLMKHLFTYGCVSVEEADHVPLKETEIGLIPDHWRVFRLKDVLREPLRNGHSARPSNDDSGIRTLILTSITQNDFSLKNTKLTIADQDKVKNLWLKSGDIFIERANTPEYVGLAALYEGNSDYAVFPDLLVRVRVNEKKIIPKFLAEYLVTEPCRIYYRSNAKATSGNFPKIDQGIIEDTLIPLPPFNEQLDIVNLFRSFDDELESELRKKGILESLFKTLLHNLMTGKTRVNELEV